MLSTPHPNLRYIQQLKSTQDLYNCKYVSLSKHLKHYTSILLTMESTISLTNQEIVKEVPIKLLSPQNPTPEETIFLSNIDQAVIFPVETLFFFEVPPNKTPASTLPVFDLVRKAVAEVLLVPYYFMAGRLQFNQESNRLELLCNNGGVLFVCAESGLELKDLGNLSLPNSTFHLLIHRPGLYNSLADTPLFTIQAIPSTLEISRKAHRKLNDILVYLLWYEVIRGAVLGQCWIHPFNSRVWCI